MSDLPMKQEDHSAHDVPDATEDYRGAQLSDMVARGRTILEKDRDDSRREAIKGGGYDSTGTFRGTK